MLFMISSVFGTHLGKFSGNRLDAFLRCLQVLPTDREILIVAHKTVEHVDW